MELNYSARMHERRHTHTHQKCSLKTIIATSTITYRGTYTKTTRRIWTAYLAVKENNNPICQSSEGLLEILHGGTTNNGDDISLIEVLYLLDLYFMNVK